MLYVFDNELEFVAGGAAFAGAQRFHALAIGLLEIVNRDIRKVVVRDVPVVTEGPTRV